MRCCNNNTNRPIYHCHIIIDILVGHIASQTPDKHGYGTAFISYTLYVFKASVNIECKKVSRLRSRALYFECDVIHCRAYLRVFWEILLKTRRASRCKDIFNVCRCYLLQGCADIQFILQSVLPFHL